MQADANMQENQFISKIIGADCPHFNLKLTFQTPVWSFTSAYEIAPMHGYCGVHDTVFYLGWSPAADTASSYNLNQIVYNDGNLLYNAVGGI